MQLKDGLMLTIASFVVRNAAKLVGTKPGATQFTRVFGAISAARAWRKQGNKISMICEIFEYRTNNEPSYTFVSPRRAVLVTPYIAMVAGGW